MGRKGLYVHIPFCARKCRYCDFVSHTPVAGEIDEYLDNIETEFRLNCIKKEEIDTIFIGGGTPTILNEKQLERLLNIISRNVDVKNVLEYTVEANPGTLNEEKLSILMSGGVNRLSIGLQAIQKKHLEFMGRIHDLEDFEDSYFKARNAGFKNINIDLIFAYDGLTIEEWKETIDYAVKINPEHISAYSLIIEEGTPFYNLFEEGNLKDIDDELYVEMYRYTVGRLEDNSYYQYEISNFAKEKKRCIHNIKYWKGEEYYGIGLGASGYLNGERYTNVDNMDKYRNALKTNKLPVKFKEKLNEIDIYNEKIMLGLRMNSGVEYSLIENINSGESKKFIKKTIDKYLEKGYIEFRKSENKKIMKLTQHGREISNTIILELML